MVQIPQHTLEALVTSLIPILSYIGKKVKDLDKERKKQNEKQNLAIYTIAKATNQNSDIDIEKLKDFLLNGYSEKCKDFLKNEPNTNLGG